MNHNQSSVTLDPRWSDEEWGAFLPSVMSACPGYQPGEIVRSNTREGHLPSDVLQDADGNRLLADFGVNSSQVKDTIKNDSVFKNWVNSTLKMALANPTAKIQIVGYSDCAGPEKNNLPLRSQRAQQVLGLLDALLGKDPRWKALRSRTVVEPAPTGSYVANNTTVEGRARNRGVVIKVQTTVTFPEDTITAGPCKTQLMERAAKLLQSAKAIQVFPAQKRQRLLNVLTNLASGRKGDRFLTQKDVEAATANTGNTVPWSRVTGYFDELCTDIGKNGRMSDDDVLHNMWRLDNLILLGICKLKNLEKNPPARLDNFYGRTWIKTLSVNVVGAMMANTNNVYSAYRSVGLSDCPVQGTPIPIPSRRPKPPQGGTPPVPRPQGQQLPGSGTGISQWLKDSLSGVAKMAGIAISGLVWAIPAPVLEKAIEAAWLVFQLENLSPNSLVGKAGERAARVIAKWALEKAGVSGNVFDVNILQKNFPGFDLLTSLRPYSVKTYNVLGQDINKAKSNYKRDILRIIGSHPADRGYRERVAAAMLRWRTELTKAGVWPTSLSGNVTKDQLVKFIRETVFLFPEDHVITMRGQMGAELFGMYKQGQSIPGIAAGLGDNDVAPLISKFVIERIQSSGLKTTDLRLMVDVARRLPDARDAVVKRGVKNWPATWGTPPTWTGSVHRP